MTSSTAITTTASTPTVPKFGEQQFTDDEVQVIRRRLEEKIGGEAISYKAGPDGSMHLICSCTSAIREF